MEFPCCEIREGHGQRSTLNSRMDNTIILRDQEIKTTVMYTNTYVHPVHVILELVTIVYVVIMRDSVILSMHF